MNSTIKTIAVYVGYLTMSTLVWGVMFSTSATQLMATAYDSAATNAWETATNYNGTLESNRVAEVFASGEDLGYMSQVGTQPETSPDTPVEHPNTQGTQDYNGRGR